MNFKEEFKKDSPEYFNKNSTLYAGTRDNCSVVTVAFITWLKRNKNITAKKVDGLFYADKNVHTKKDFTPDELQKIKKLGYDISSSDKLKKFLDDHTYFKEMLRYIPHTWCEIDGEILDISGELQFIDTNLSADCNPHRYIRKNPNDFYDEFALVHDIWKSSKKKMTFKEWEIHRAIDMYDLKDDAPDSGDNIGNYSGFDIYKTIEKNNIIYFLKNDDGIVIAYLGLLNRITINNINFTYLTCMWVDPIYRKTGLFTVLLGYLLNVEKLKIAIDYDLNELSFKSIVAIFNKNTYSNFYFLADDGRKIKNRETINTIFSTPELSRANPYFIIIDGTTGIDMSESVFRQNHLEYNRKNDIITNEESFAYYFNEIF